MALVAILMTIGVLWYQLKDGARNTENEVRQVFGWTKAEHADNKATIKRMTGVSDAEYAAHKEQWYPGEKRTVYRTLVEVGGWVCAALVIWATFHIVRGY